MCEKSENSQTWFTIDHPKDHSILHQTTPFCILFPAHAGFSGKSGVGVRAEGGSCKAEGIAGQVMRKKIHQLHIRTGGFHESRGCRAACGHWGCI